MQQWRMHEQMRAKMENKRCSSTGCTNKVVNGGVYMRHGAKVEGQTMQLFRMHIYLSEGRSVHWGMEQQQRCEAEAMRRQKGRMQKNQAQLGVGVCVKLGHTCPQNYAGSKGVHENQAPFVCWGMAPRRRGQEVWCIYVV
jgi:hypothetical protein